MQLNAPAAGADSIRAALAAATALLLAPAGAAAEGGADWHAEGALLYYKEGGGRVTAIEPVLSVRRTDGNDRTQGLKLTLDTLTGASPNGAVAQPTPQTFTSPSGERTYTTPAGQLPLDSGFRDQRAALAFSLEQPAGAGRRLNAGASFSGEHDFRSFGANAALAQDFDDRNTTLSIGAAFEYDGVQAVGGAPRGLAPAFNGEAGEGSRHRSVADLLLGLTQVMSRGWLMQLNLGLGRGQGYHSDPYKVLSVVDGTSGLLTGSRYVSEQRPDTRSRASVYWQNKLGLGEDVVDLSYRYYRDDWGVRAHTLDLRYRWELGGGLHLEPQWRGYRQTAADFWRGWLVEGREWSSATQIANVSAASADPRLGAFSASTLGLKVGLALAPGSELTLRLSRYRQVQKRPADAPGVLQTLDVAPSMTATSFVAGYTRDF